MFTEPMLDLTHFPRGPLLMPEPLLTAHRQKFFHVLKHQRHHSEKLQRAWNKYGEESFVFETLDITEDLIKREQFFIDQLNAYLSGYNCHPSAGHARGYRHKEETKRKMRDKALRIASQPEESERRSKQAKKQHEKGVLGAHTLSSQGRASLSKKGNSEIWKKAYTKKTHQEVWTTERRAAKSAEVREYHRRRRSHARNPSS